MILGTAVIVPSLWVSPSLVQQMGCAEALGHRGMFFVIELCDAVLLYGL